MKKDEVLSGEVLVKGKRYTLRLIRYENGCYLDASREGSNRLGALSIAIPSQRGPISSQLIPVREGNLAAALLSEALAALVKGIAVVSFYSPEEPSREELMQLIKRAKELAQRRPA